MGLLATLVDNFNDNVVGPEWGNFYGGVTEVGGKARVPCTTGFAGYQSAYQWTLAGSSVYVQVPTRPSATGATAEAYAQFMVNSPTDGTRLGFTINMVGTKLRMQNDVGYFDAGATEITYSGTTHLWLRIRETGGNVLWDTSPDGTTWTNRRTLATPAWVTSSIDTCALDLSAHRDGGTADVAEFDNVNTMTNGAVVTGAAALSSATALTATATRSAIAAADLDGEAALDASPRVTYRAAAALTATATLEATASADDSDHIVSIGSPSSGWEVGAPWT